MQHKEVLKKHKILRTDTTKGKMAIRVYPSWDNPTSKQAIAMRIWQLNYFVEFNKFRKLPVDDLKRLYLKED